MVWVELCPFSAVSHVFPRLTDVTFKKIFTSVIILDSGGLKVPGELVPNTEESVHTKTEAVIAQGTTS